MKRIIKYMVFGLVRLWSYIYTYSTSVWLKNYRDSLYTLWIRRFLGKLGDNSIIKYPCSLQGGGAKRIIIGNKTTIESHGILGCWEKYGEKRFFPELVIGDNCWIGEYTQITSSNKIIIGDGLLTGRYVYIGDNAHGDLSMTEADIPPIKRQLYSKGEIKIGINVWIGDKVSVFGGVTIGDNVIIGAGAVVTHDVPSNSIAVGVPAKVVKRLDVI